MGFKHHTASANDALTQGPDTALSVIIIIDSMTPFERLKCFSQSLLYSNFCLQLMPPRSTVHYFPICQPLKNN